MSNNLFVGNLTYSVSNSDLETLFGQYGQVTSAQVITDRETGRSRGFGFVEMASPGDAEAAIREHDGKEFEGRTLTVNEAKPMVPRDNSGGGDAYGQNGVSVQPNPDRAVFQDVEIGPDGAVYVLTDESDGRVLKLALGER